MHRTIQDPQGPFLLCSSKMMMMIMTGLYLVLYVGLCHSDFQTVLYQSENPNIKSIMNEFKNFVWFSFNSIGNNYIIAFLKNVVVVVRKLCLFTFNRDISIALIYRGRILIELSHPVPVSQNQMANCMKIKLFIRTSV